MCRNAIGQRAEGLAPDVGRHGGGRADDGGQAVQVRQRTAALLRQRCARLGAWIKTSTEVMGGHARPEQRAARRVPWLGLVLWVCACAALFASLIMHPDGLDRDRRVAARTEVKEQSSGFSDPVRSWSWPASELGSLPYDVRHRVERRPRRTSIGPCAAAGRDRCASEQRLIQA
jgi:hypothetical protein